MTKEQVQQILILLHDFDPECNQDCHNCEFGVMRGYGETDTCPINIVEDLLYTKFFNLTEWKRLHG